MNNNMKELYSKVFNDVEKLFPLINLCIFACLWPKLTSTTFIRFCYLSNATGEGNGVLFGV